MQAYAKRHYGIDSWRLRSPKVIVEHITVSSTFGSAYATFAADRPDCRAARAARHLRPLRRRHRRHDLPARARSQVMCRHTVGLNWTAIGIEHVGLSDAQVLGNARQLAASLALTAWLMGRFHIGLGDVIGHNESLHEPVPQGALRGLALPDARRLEPGRHDDVPRPARRRSRRRERRAPVGSAACAAVSCRLLTAHAEAAAAGPRATLRTRDLALDRHRDRRRPPARTRLPLQQGRPAPERGEHGLVEHRRAAEAAERPDPEPRRDREGLRRPRARRLRGGHEGAGRDGTGFDAGRGGRRRQHPRPGARPSLRGRRGVPRPEGVAELPPAAVGADRHGGQDLGRAALLQRHRARVQQRDPDVPDAPLRGRRSASPRASSSRPTRATAPRST